LKSGKTHRNIFSALQPRRTTAERIIRPAIRRFAWVACVIALLPRPAVAEDPSAKRILLLHQNGIAEPIHARFDVAFVEALRSAGSPSIPIDLYEETIETRRFPGSEQSWLAREYLKRKYADRTIDVIVTLGSVPLTFARLNRDLFGTPSIVALVTPSGQLDPGDNVTGLQGGFWIDGTIDLALSLLPGTQSVFVIEGARSNADDIKTEVERQLKDRGRLNLVYLKDIPLGELIARVRAIPPHSIVLYVGQSMRTASLDIDQFDALKEIVRASPAPIFSQFEEFLGRGVVGGYMWRSEDDARRMAEMALRIVGGTSARDIPAGRGTYATLLDWSQLQRWNIPDTRLPAASIVLFRPQSFFESYRWYVVGGLLVFIGQLALIVGLVVHRARRRRAEEDARRSRENLAHLTRVSAMGELAASLAHELNQPLSAILANARAATRLLATDGDVVPELRDILQDIVDDDKRAAEVISRVREMVSKRTTERVPVDLNEIVRTVTRMLTSDSIIRQVPIELDFSPAPLIVSGDRVQLEQVVLNLLLNAFEATSTSNRLPRTVVVTTNASDRQSAHLVVRDNGPGLKSGSEGRVFEPFYTTKGSGMGMGLSIARSIVESHGGRIWAANALERGAEFHLTLPRTAAQSPRIA